MESSYKVIEVLLRKTKAILLWAKNGRETIDLCRSNNNINLVLMDIRMPEIDGFQATREIKQFRKKLPVIAITAFAMREDEEKSIEAGCDGYISKPIDHKMLLSQLSKYLD
ncbi:MAG: response regulator [Bacteroidales bacterium]|nr:response regulator [Bacteroidales bacterium]